MATIHGNTIRPQLSRGAPHLLDPAGVEALAVAGQVLLDAINAGGLVVSDRATPRSAARLHTLIDRLYVLQDAIYGSSTALRAVLADVCAASESEALNG